MKYSLNSVSMCLKVVDTRATVGAVGIELSDLFKKTRVYAALPTANQMKWS